MRKVCLFSVHVGQENGKHVIHDLCYVGVKFIHHSIL